MRGFALVVGALLVVAAPVAAQSVEAGIEAWQRGDHVAAVEIWKPLAREGDADAAFNIGQAYRLGRGVPLDLATAQGWLERAARKDHVDAQTTLGLLLFQNGNRTSGLRWLKNAADQGEPRALLIYGTALFNGDGVPRDPVLAYAFVSRAAAQGLEPAKITLEEMDRILPLDERRKGVALALDMAKAPQSETKAKPAPKAAQAAKPPSKVAKAEPKSGGWRIQLGAFSKRASADTLFERLSGSAVLAGKSKHLVAGGKVTRLQVGPFESRAAAQNACASLEPQPCFAVGPD